jgi:hypothetical protein
LRTYDSGALDVSEIVCEVCEERGTSEVAQSILLTATRNFFYCGVCQSWLLTEMERPELVRQIVDKRLINALNYYYLGQMQMASPLFPEIVRALRRMYNKLQDFLIGMYGLDHDGQS